MLILLNYWFLFVSETCASAKVGTNLDKGTGRGAMGQCQEKEGAEREIQGGQHIPVCGRLGQGALTSTGGSTSLWEHQNCRFLAAVEVFGKSGDLPTLQRKPSTGFVIHMIPISTRSHHYPCVPSNKLRTEDQQSLEETKG